LLVFLQKKKILTFPKKYRVSFAVFTNRGCPDRGARATLRVVRRLGGGMISLVLASVLFAFIHLGISGTHVRDTLTGRIGQAGYMILFSVLSVLDLVWMIYAYNHAPYMPTWGNPGWAKALAVLLMLPAFLFVVIGLTTPNPTAVAQEKLASRPPVGIVTITRHPFLMGTALWSLLHLLANGDLASLLFFGSLAVVSVAGPASIDAKRRRALGAPVWDSFASQTSIVPFLAIVQGRTKADYAGVGSWRPVAGFLAYAVMLGGHSHIVGVSPFPW
jgi:uncharacterized membrane protein